MIEDQDQQAQVSERIISQEDAQELRKISDIKFRENEFYDWKKEKYLSLSDAEIIKHVKENVASDTKDILFHREDLPLKTLEFIYRRNKGLRFGPTFYPSPVPMERVRAKHAEALGLIACHPNVSFDLLLKIAKHESPEARFIATGSPHLPPSIKQTIYREIVENKGYGDRVLLLRALCKSDISSNLRNKGFQQLFSSESFLKDDRGETVFAEELPIEVPKYPNAVFSNDSSRYFLASDLRDHQFKLKDSLRGLAFVDGLTMETIDIILNSGHYISSRYLYANENLPVQAYEKFFNSSVALSDNWNDLMLLEYLANNPSTPQEILKEMTAMSMPDLSYKRRGSKYSTVGRYLAKNPSMPLEALITLRSLHNEEERQKSYADPSYHTEAEIAGPPLDIWRSVEDHPTYKAWVAETPNYKELLPSVIKCTCHNL